MSEMEIKIQFDKETGQVKSWGQWGDESGDHFPKILQQVVMSWAGLRSMDMSKWRDELDNNFEEKV